MDTRITAWVSEILHGAHLVDIAERDTLDRLVLEDFTNDTTVTASDDQDILGVGVRCEGEMGNHLLVPGMRSGWGDDLRKFVSLGTLNDVVKDEDVSIGFRFEDENVLGFQRSPNNDSLGRETFRDARFP